MQAPRPDVDAVDVLQAAIDFPPTPDEVRSRSQSASHVNTAGCTSGLAGLATLVFGLAGLAAAVYVCVEASKPVGSASRDTGVGQLGYGFGGTVGALAGMLVTYGIGQVCYAAAKHRDAREERLELSEQARFESTMGGRLA
ncbi:hypothetical protein [Pandoraea sp. XY-2]|uniref:hypothetical protein n=1 Tax=Pandoraea sp. XY-2 TaxID=2518599 RepID=UPI00101B102F|nr:hypothetical protein [Pandoraea sp. XY-2]QBC30663.1 hypothetical protein DRB87_03840 [Pandoraea sp. XY-2]